MLPKARFGRAAPWLLAAGALLHGIAFARFHTLPNPPPLTDLPSAVSLAAWLAVLASLALLGAAGDSRARRAGRAARLPRRLLRELHARRDAAGRGRAPAGSWPHLHVILASAGLALLGVAGLAGVLFLVRSARAEGQAAVRRGGAGCRRSKRSTA